MATSADSTVAPPVTRISSEAVRLLWSFTRELVWSCFIRSLLRLPLAVAVCTALCLVLALVPAAVLQWSNSPLVSRGYAALLIGLYGLAGVLWGIHWTLRRGTQIALAVVEKHAAEVIDLVLGSTRLPPRRHPRSGPRHGANSLAAFRHRSRRRHRRAAGCAGGPPAMGRYVVSLRTACRPAA